MAFLGTPGCFQPKMTETGSALKYGWKANGCRLLNIDRRSPYIKLTARQLYEVLPFLFRHFLDGVLPFIDSFRPLVYKPIYGVPCGGIGSGSIGRGYRGEFCKFALRPGLVEHRSTVMADQFIVNIRERDQTVYQQALCTNPPSAKQLASWSFNFPPENLEYVGLFPRSWTSYKIPGRNIRLVCRQVSPVFPHDYKDISLPVAVFVWEIHSDEATELTVSIALTFRNGIGNHKFDRHGKCSSFGFAQQIDASQYTARGVCLQHQIDEMPCTYALASSDQVFVLKKQHDDATVSYNLQFKPRGNGSDLWIDLLSDGSLDAGSEAENAAELGVAVCVKCRLKPGPQKMEVPIVLAWDMPIIHFIGKRRNYRRRYTKWFGSDGKAGPRLCAYALQYYRKWEERIDLWQNPVLDNGSLPDWYKSALFNELYYITDGGSTWLEFEDQWREDEPHMSDYTAKVLSEYGRFGYLESWEYRMFNTYDVHFYASFAMALLWPQLEHSIQAEFCDMIPFENVRSVKYHFEGDIAHATTKWRVPHDAGNPGDDPWLAINAYEMHNTARWRDLNLKFILQSYRDYLMLGEGAEGKALLEHVWPAVQKLVEVGLTEWDSDRDSMIENSSTCDQTYDAWIMSGTSAYCGGLWLAALQTASKIAAILNLQDEALKYDGILASAQIAFDKKLWTGEYYKFDEFSRKNDSIMADQLCGLWYVQACGIGDKVLHHEKVMTCLRKIYDFNVIKFANGKRGAVNGMRPNGHVDDVCLQSPEVWTGVTYALGAHMIQEGMVPEGFTTASGVYNTCFIESGLQFQTPEAYHRTKYYRAIGYMRPLAIWSMQWALERFRNFPDLDFAPVRD